MYQETFRYMEKLARAVHEGRAVDEASNYCRWFLFSGFCKFFEAHAQPPPCEVSGQKLRDLADSIVAACGEIYKCGKLPQSPSQSRIDELNQKMDVVLSCLAKSIPPPSLVDLGPQ